MTPHDPAHTLQPPPIATAHTGPLVTFDVATNEVRIIELSIDHPAVLSEALRWSHGHRSEAVTTDELGAADLTAFVTQAVVIGTQAITSAGGTQDTFNVERLLSDLGARTVEATTVAADATGQTVKQAVESVQAASQDAAKALTEAGDRTRKAFGESVDAATTSLRGDVQRLLGGDNPELLERLTPILDSFRNKLDTQATEQTRALLDKAAHQFDPTDPTSPMAKHTRALEKQQSELKHELEKNHTALASRIEDLSTAVKVATSAKDAGTRLANVTPLKGGTYEEGIHAVMEDIASGLGDEYEATGTTVGALARCKKGDGLLTIADSAARVVLEMTDSKRTVWSEYLDEAERNRRASASLGLVRNPEQLGGGSIKCISARRIVMTFDPETDDTDLLRTVVQLLRLQAIAASARRDGDGIETADEKLTEAIAMLAKIDTIRTTAGTIRKGANKIEVESNSLQSDLQRVLNEARDAIAGLADADASDDLAA